jgi:putative ABC transport system ATP-binding protein
MTAVLALSGVSRDFVQGDEVVHALTPTDLTVGAGEFIGVIGPSGSGKSTLLTVMGGLRRPTRGTVTIEGEPFSELPERQRSRVRLRRMGFILQAASLVPFLAIADQFALHDHAARAAARTAARDGLLDELGIRSLAGKYPSDLSGGERQRAAIAVALYHDPQVVLADEPTAALDTHRALDVARILAEQTHGRGKATVMVTHDERLLGVCDRVLSMEDGTLTPR